MSDVAAKKLEAFAQSRPEQLTLFELLDADDRKYSNTIELYDALPKYHWGKVQRINERFLLSLEREFEYRGVRYKLKIRPARIDDIDGVERDYYPSQREELVEDALRKLACEGNGCFLDDQASVVFTLYQLQQELQRMGHGYKITDIKEALLICANTGLELTRDDGTAVIDGEQTTLISHLFETVGLQTREDWQSHGKKAKAFVRFNPLVTHSIKNKTFRQLNYEKCMSYKSVIARQLHKRMSHLYTQASLMNTYSILLSTIIRDFGLTLYAQLRDNLRDVVAALQEMKSKDIVVSYKIDKVFAKDRKNKIEDVKFTLTPHPRFTSDIIKANQRHKEIKNTGTPNPTTPLITDTTSSNKIGRQQPLFKK